MPSLSVFLAVAKVSSVVAKVSSVAAKVSEGDIILPVVNLDISYS